MQTNFAALQPQQKRAWGHAAYKEFRDNFFWNKFMGKGDSAVVERITELTKTDKGTSIAMLHLVGDLVGGGITGDNQLEGRESTLQSYWQEVQIGRLRKGVRNKGKLSEQRSVINFRTEAKDKLGQWLAETMDDLMFLTASGISYDLMTDGSPRPVPAGEDALSTLDFAADLKVPSANRHYRWAGASGLLAGNTAVIDSTHVPSYRMIVDLIAEAKTKRVRPIKSGGKDYYVLLVHPKTYAFLKKDPEFRDAIVNAGERGAKNPIFTGAIVTMDGAVIHEHTRVYNTLGAAATQKWGAGGNVNGTRSLLLGAQALALADLEVPQWEEEKYDYGNQQGIAIDKMFGLLKPQFYNRWTRTVEDFGVMVCDTFIA